jgi:hypothetical protein
MTHRRGKVQFSLAWSFLESGTFGWDWRQMFHDSHITYIRLSENVAGEDPEKQNDWNLFSWKDSFVGRTHALPHSGQGD